MQGLTAPNAMESNKVVGTFALRTVTTLSLKGLFKSGFPNLKMMFGTQRAPFSLANHLNLIPIL